MAHLRHAALIGTLGEPTRLTLAAYLTRWLEDAARPATREATYQLYEGLVPERTTSYAEQTYSPLHSMVGLDRGNRRSPARIPVRLREDEVEIA